MFHSPLPCGTCCVRPRRRAPITTSRIYGISAYLFLRISRAGELCCHRSPDRQHECYPQRACFPVTLGSRQPSANASIVVNDVDIPIEPVVLDANCQVGCECLGNRGRGGGLARSPQLLSHQGTKLSQSRTPTNCVTCNNLT